MKDKYKKTVNAANRKNRNFFLSVPFNKRIVLLPQCLRNSKECKAKEKGPYFICARCGKCRISEIIKKAEKLGYGEVFVLKGGKIIPEIFKKKKPSAIVGVACYYEGFMGVGICEEFKIPVQFFPLLRDGCSDTELDIKKFLKFISR